MMFLVEFDLSLIFQGFESILEGYFDDFINVKSGKSVDFLMFCRTHYRTQKWVFRRGNIRYALSGNQTLVLKCKLCPIMA